MNTGNTLESRTKGEPEDSEHRSVTEDEARKRTRFDDDGFDLAPEKVTITLGADTFINSQAATFLIAIGNVTGTALVDLSADGV